MQQGACRLIPGIIRKTSRQQLTPKRGRQRGGRDVRHACPPVVRAHALRHPDQRAMLRCRLCSNVFCFVVSVRNEGTGGPWCDALWSVTLFATLQGPLRSTVTKVEHIFVISLLSAYVRCVARSPLLNKVNRFNPKHVRPGPTRAATS